MENLHFRSVIDVEAIGSPAPGFKDLVQEIGDWICLKEGSSADWRSAAWFADSGSWKKPNGKANVLVDSIPDPQAEFLAGWAVRYSHQDAEFAARWWTIDIGIVPVEPNRWRLALTVGNSLHRTFMGQEPGRLPVTPPRILTSLAASSRWRCSAGSAQFSIGPILVKVGEGHRLRDAVEDRSRHCALVYVARDRLTEQPLVDSMRLARSIVGSGVVYVAGSSELDDELEYLIPLEYRAPNGMVRVYAPGARLDKPDQSFRHRFFTRRQIADLSAAEVEQQIARSLARRTGWATLVSSVGSIDDIATQRRDARLAELRSERTDASQRELLALFEQANAELTVQKRGLEQSLDDAVQRAEEVEFQLEEVRDNVRSLEYERDALRNESVDARRRAAALEQAVTTARGLSSLPTSLVEVLELIGRLHAESIAFTPEAIASARAAQINELPSGCDIAWKHLHAAATVLPRLAFDEGVSGASLPNRFLTETGCDLTMTEGKLTKADSRLLSARAVTFEGKEWDTTPHIKYGAKAPKCLRIHFALDRDKRRIVVGHCGDHLETAGNRRSG